MIEARDIIVARRGRRLLDGVSLSVLPGEVLAILGPNGAGKSTLMGVLSGAVAPDRGTVLMDGRPLARWPRTEAARCRAVLPQASLLSFPFGSLEVVLLGRSPHAGRSDGTRDLRIAEAAMAEAGVLHLAERSYDTLSGGERQRVQLARVLAQIWEPACGPRYLLLDEPTAGLDPAHQHALMRSARRFAAQGCGVAVVLHDLSLAGMYADRAVLLRRGAIAACGRTEAVLTPGLLQRVFDIPMTVISVPDVPHRVIVSGVGSAAAEPDGRCADRLA